MLQSILLIRSQLRGTVGPFDSLFLNGTVASVGSLASSGTVHVFGSLLSSVTNRKCESLLAQGTDIVHGSLKIKNSITHLGSLGSNGPVLFF